MLCKKWTVSELDKNIVESVSERFGIDPFLAILLQIRGITKEDSINEFLYDNDSLIDPMEFPDMDKAVDRILCAINKFERICVYGDYDADGVTSTALLYSYLNDIGANVIYYIPDRYKEGYGLNIKAIEKLKSQGVSLIVTVDNGVSAIDEVKYANSIGMNVVITDHHQVPKTLPSAFAVVNPHREDCNIKFKDFAGVGVAFKLICALEDENFINGELASRYIDLVAIGTVGDVVPLYGENRRLVKEGLRCLEKKSRIGIKRLIDFSGITSKSLNSTSISFSIVPRINACGRLKNANIAVKLLLAETYEQADYLTSELNDLNDKRKKIELEILKQVEDFLSENPQRILDHIIVAEGEDFHPGVIGIVASRIVDKYSKPCIIISKNENVSRGSGRGVEGFSIYDTVKKCSDYFTKFGGHHVAVGFDILTDKISDFVKDVNKFACEEGEVPVPCLKLDCKLRPESISLDFLNQIDILEPFGSCNPSPLFGLFNMKVEKIQPVGGGKHLRLTISRDKVRFTAMKFNTSFENFGFVENDVVDVAVTLNRDFFREVENISIFITDIKMSGVSRDDVVENLRLYESIRRNEIVDSEKISNVIPNRDDFVTVYKFLSQKKDCSFSLENLWYRLSSSSINICKLELIIDIMHELGLITLCKHPTMYNISINKLKSKVDLCSSNILKTLKGTEGE